MKITTKQYRTLLSVRESLAATLNEIEELRGFVEGPIEKARAERAYMLVKSNLARIRAFKLKVI